MKLRFHNLLIFSGLVLSLILLLGGFDSSPQGSTAISTNTILGYYADGAGFDRDVAEGKIVKGGVYSRLNKSHKLLTGRDLAQFE